MYEEDSEERLLTWTESDESFLNTSNSQQLSEDKKDKKPILNNSKAFEDSPIKSKEGKENKENLKIEMTPIQNAANGASPFTKLDFKPVTTQSDSELEPQFVLGGGGNNNSQSLTSKKIVPKINVNMALQMQKTPEENQL